MQPTELLYLKDFRTLSCKAHILAVRETEDAGARRGTADDEARATEDAGRTTVVLDQTIFYPQGGGQPYDKGIIESPSGKFIVEEVRYSAGARGGTADDRREDEGVVNHIGVFESGAFTDGEEVDCTVDEERREFHSRIHSAGHVLDWAVLRLGLSWKPGKGYHFPDGPYVEYEGGADASNSDKEKLKTDIEAVCNTILAEDHETKAVFVEKEAMAALCHFVPENIPSGKPGRVMRFGDAFGVPCGGTHVARLGEIKKMVIRKIKQSGNTIRVGYEVQ